MSVKNGWLFLTGDPAEFSMENRAFNYVSLITFPLLFYYFIFDIYIGQVLMSYIIALLVVILGFLYYFSRFRKLYLVPMLVYAASSYVALIINYYINAGITGSTLLVFFLTFHLLIAIGRPRQYPIWIALQIGIAGFLLWSEYAHPEWVPNTFETRRAKFLDIGCTYATGIIFIFVVVRYLRDCFERERKTAEDRALAILESNALITRQNQLLEQLNSEKDKLFSIVSHDLRAPIDSILGYLELLNNNQLDPEEKSLLEAELLVRTRYTADMIMNLVSWAKAQMQGVSADLKTINLSEMVHEIVANKIPVTLKKGVDIASTVPAHLEVHADTDMLRIIIRNLINNAVKFTMQGGKIHLTASENMGEIIFSVKDTGMGIAAEKHSEIFSQGTVSTYGTNNEKGIGLGLKMCKEFVEYQHGRIWFESSPGVGSVFYVALPAPLPIRA